MRISDWSSDVCSSDLVTPILDGWHGDSSRMYLVGDVPLKARRLVDVTYEAMMRGIEQARPGNHLGDVGHAIERFVAKYRYGIVRDFCGHGLGRVFHDAPDVAHIGKPVPGPAFLTGRFFTVCPRTNTGTPAW